MRLHVPVGLRWSDLDAYGHVNNVNLLRLLEEARIATFWLPEHGSDSTPTGALALVKAQPGEETRTVIAHHEVEYLAQIPYQRDPLDIEMWLGKIGGASFEIYYEIWSNENHNPRTLYGRASTTLVFLDAESNRPRRIRDEERAAWAPYVEAPVVFRTHG